MNEYIVKYVTEVGLAGLSIVVLWIVWLKNLVHNEIVKPDIDNMKKEISDLREELKQTRQYVQDQNNEFKANFAQINDSILGLTKTVSELTGTIKFLLNDKK